MTLTSHCHQIGKLSPFLEDLFSETPSFGQQLGVTPFSFRPRCYRTIALKSLKKGSVFSFFQLEKTQT